MAAVTENLYTGNGSTTNFPFTFPYLNGSDIKVSVDGVNVTTFTLFNPTTVKFNTAPASGKPIRIYRQTDNSDLAATFYPGSAIRSQDLNDNFTQGLYSSQEASADATTAKSLSTTAASNSATALAASASAVSASNAAVSTANTANTNASAAVSTANTASTNASTALSTANSASTAATAAVNTANTAATNASSAVSTANTASSAASSAVNTANTASTNASAAVSTANTASSNATFAVSTANSASATSSTAINTANSANSKADAAIAAVANSVNYLPVADVASIPATAANNTYIEVNNSTGIQSFTPLTGIPVGFVGDTGLRARLRFTTSGSTWVWLDYATSDPEARYVKTNAISTSVSSTSATNVASSSAVKVAKDAADSASAAASAAQTTANTAVTNAATAQSTANSAVSAASTAQTTADAALPKAGGVMSGAITFAAGQAFPPASTTAAGIVQLSDSTSSTSSSTAGTSAAIKAVQDFAQVVSITANAALPRAGGTISGNIDNSSTGYFDLPSGTTAQRPGSPNSGMIRFNTDLLQFEGHTGSAWSAVGGGATGGGADRWAVEHDNTITQSYTIGTGKNVISAGPITIQSGAVVTVPSNSAWSIV